MGTNSGYDNTNRGALFRNKRKTSDKHPDYTGSVNVDGQEYWLSAWVKNSPSAGNFFSLSITPKETRADNGESVDMATPTSVKGGGGSSAKPKSDDMGDDIPF